MNCIGQKIYSKERLEVGTQGVYLSCFASCIGLSVGQEFRETPGTY
jgi:hypothetical protein